MSHNGRMGDAVADKYNFINKYDNLPKSIKANQTCYVIASEWWLNFECLLNFAKEDDDLQIGDFSPINNTPLLYRLFIIVLNPSEIQPFYKNLLKSSSPNGPINDEVLSELTDWDEMALKPNLKYGSDFYIISSSVWKFLLNKYKGGPEIELITETNEYHNDHQDSIITKSQEPNFGDKITVNMNLMKIYVTKDEEIIGKMAKYVSPTITVRSLLDCLCQKFLFSPSKSSFSYFEKQDWIEVKDKTKTLQALGLHEGVVVNLSQKIDVENSLYHDNISPSKNKQKELDDFHENLFGNNGDVPKSHFANNESSNRYKDHEGMDIESQFGHKTEEKKESDYPKNDNFPDLITFVAKMTSKQDQQKIELRYKTIQEIKLVMGTLLKEWDPSNSITQHKKI